MAGFEGGCMCGAVRYQSTADPMAFMLCHCRECQYVSGGEPASVVIVPKDAVKVTGMVKGYDCTSEQGRRVTRQFCPECGTPMFSDVEVNPAILVVKAGTMDDASGLTPSAILWTSSAHPWAHIDPNVPQFEKDPPAAA